METVRTIGHMPRTRALVGGPGWSVADPVRARFAVYLCAASGLDEMPSEQRPERREEGNVEKMHLGLRYMRPSWMDWRK
jgi:hypothetical protein